MGGDDAEGNPHITSNGTATPAVNPLGWSDTAPWTAGRYVVCVGLNLKCRY